MNKEKVIEVSKYILSKLILFLFCVGFISGYSFLFGKENSICGVVLIMSLLMFIDIDFNFNAKSAAILIPITIVSAGVFAKLSLYNAFLGIIINTIIIGFILVLTRKNQMAYLPFLMGYIMFRGYNVTGEIFYKRIISLVIIGGLIGFLYFLKNKDKCYNENITDLFKSFNIYNDWERWSVVILFSIVTTCFVNDAMNIPKYMWVELTVLSLISPIKNETHKRKYLRVPATILGCILFFILFEVLVPTQYQNNLVLIAGFLSMFITSYFIKIMYNSFSALVAATLIFPVHDAIMIRVFNNIIGAIFVVVFVFIFTNIFKLMDRKNNQLKTPNIA